LAGKGDKMTKRMKWAITLMFLAIYGRTFGGLILDGWLDCACMTVGVFLWLFQPTRQ